MLSRFNPQITCLLSLFALFIAGCSAKLQEPKGPVYKTSPVKGIVEVDGVPTENVEVTARPAADSTTIKYPQMCTTDKSGKFAFAMYKQGDGLPAGNYTLTFELNTGEAKKQGIKSGGPSDVFNGAYARPEKSQHKVNVTEGAPQDLGVISLSKNGPAKK